MTGSTVHIYSQYSTVITEDPNIDNCQCTVSICHQYTKILLKRSEQSYLYTVNFVYCMIIRLSLHMNYSYLRGRIQTIFGKINVIVTLWGEGVIGHDV